MYEENTLRGERFAFGDQGLCPWTPPEEALPPLDSSAKGRSALWTPFFEVQIGCFLACCLIINRLQSVYKVFLCVLVGK